jgi:hypothetical protein
MRTVLLLAALSATTAAHAQGAEATKTPDAFAVVSKAMATAGASGRNLWIKFDASW